MQTQMLLLLAAAEQLGDPALLWRAAEQVGIGQQDAEQPELYDLLAVEPRVAFRHPLMRSAVYQGAPPDARRRAHEALAAAIGPELDPDRRAWHRGAASVRPDEDVASELERSAERAGRRGGLASQAAFLERAAELSTDDVSRSRRLVAAAEAHSFAGAPQRALVLLDRAARAADGSLEQAEALRLRARTALDFGETAEAASLFVRAALAYESLDIRAARDMVLEALGYCYWAGPGAMHDARDDGKGAPVCARARDDRDGLLMDGFADLYLGDWPAAAPPLHEAIARARAGELSRWEAPGGERIPFWVAWWAAMHLCDLEAWRELISSGMESFRRRGHADVARGDALSPQRARGVLRSFRSCRGVPRRGTRRHGGDRRSAAGQNDLHRGRAARLSWREAEARAAVERLGETSATRGEGDRVVERGPRRAVRARSQPRQLRSGARRRLGCSRPIPVHRYQGAAGFGGGGVPASATRKPPERGSYVCSERAQASGSSWALGLLARSQALVADEGQAEGRFWRKALAQLRTAGATLISLAPTCCSASGSAVSAGAADAHDQLRTAHECST